MNNNTDVFEYYNLLFNNYPDVVKAKDLKEMLPRTGKNKVYDLLRTEQIKSKKIGKIYYIPKINIINYLIKN